MIEAREDSLPEYLPLVDRDKSLQYFYLLEAFSDGMGGWRVLDVLGKPIIDLPDWLVHDLLALRRVTIIMRRQRQEEDEKQRIERAGWQRL